jgi:hypothetical protein
MTKIRWMEIGMRDRLFSRLGVVAVAVAAAGLLGCPTSASAQTVSGQAQAVHATALGLFGATTTVLADTGALASASDALQASALSGSVPSLVAADVLHATTIGLANEVDSEASLADLALTVAGTTVGADFVMSRAFATMGAAPVGISNIDNLSINGVPIPVSGAPNQTVSIPGGVIVINEQQTSPSSTTVNALHVTVYGIADVVLGSAKAGIQ